MGVRIGYGLGASMEQTDLNVQCKKEAVWDTDRGGWW